MNRVSMVLACAAMLFAVQPAAASEEVSSSELAEMRELVNELKQKVDAQEEQIEHQGQLLEQAQDVARRQQEEGAQSGLSPFLDSIDVGGHVAGSWNWNFDDPSSELGGANVNQFYPFHADHNTFVVNQIWLGIGKPATEESPGGFQFDIFYGNDANFLGQGTGFETNHSFNPRLEDVSVADTSPLGRRFASFDSTSDYYIAQAYVEYQCNCLGPELNFKFGKWQTLVGAEVVQATGNFNITRGLVYSQLQPVDHLGLTSTAVLGPVELTLGIMNSGSSSISSPDINKEKSYMVSALVGNDEMNVRGSFIYGADPIVGFSVEEYADDFQATNNLNSVRSGTGDLTAWFSPTESLSTWANYTYYYVEGSSAWAHGVAVAGRLQITEALGAALRGEYVRVNQPNDGDIQNVLFFDTNMGDSELYSITGTFDYALSDHLTARIEGRFDKLKDKTSGDGFLENSEGDADNQTVGLVELVYDF